MFAINLSGQANTACWYLNIFLRHYQTWKNLIRNKKQNPSLAYITKSTSTYKERSHA